MSTAEPLVEESSALATITDLMRPELNEVAQARLSRALATIREGLARSNQRAANAIPCQPPQAPLNWEELDGKEPPTREWVIPHWIPHGHPVLLGGNPGIGKTLIAQCIGTALALEESYIEPLIGRRVLMWAGEDDEDELHRRQLAINRHFNRPLSDLTERLFLHSYAGADMTLAGTVYGTLQPTRLLEELRQQVNDYRAEFVILDNSARIFGGSENDRHMVTTFLAWLQAACKPAGIMLLAHPSKAIGSEFSGSTAWEGGVRARLYLSSKPPRSQDEDNPVDDSVRFLARRKANYSALDIRRFTLIDGVLRPDSIEPTKAHMPSGEFAKDIVRRAVRTLAERDMYGSASTSSPNYLPKLAEQYRLLETATKRDFADTMRKMIVAGDLVSQEVGKYPNRNPKNGLVCP